MSASSGGSAPAVPAPPGSNLRQALRYWEPRRIGYNLALAALAAAIVISTWPHFRPAFATESVPPLVVLAALANLCYCAVYPVELAMGHAASWRRWRWTLWAGGTLLALLIECYWILDEIYPAVPYR